MPDTVAQLDTVGVSGYAVLLLSLLALTVPSGLWALQALTDWLGGLLENSSQFLSGALSAFLLNTLWFLRPLLPDPFRALAAQPDEPLWRRIGRIVGDLLSLLYGIGGITTGGGMAGAGGLVCAAGVAAGGVGEVATCPVSLPLLVGGAALAVYGGGVALTSVQDLLAQLGVVLKAAAGGDEGASVQPTTPAGRTLTKHAQESLTRHGYRSPFNDVDNVISNANVTTLQRDGATVYIQRVGGRQRSYNIVIVSEEGIVTGLKNLNPSELRNLGRNYEFDPGI